MVKQISEFTDLRIAEKEIQTVPDLARNYYIHLLPQLEYAWWTVKDYKYKEDRVNLYKYTCTCSEHQQRAEQFLKPRDVRRACRHIYWKLKETRLKQHIDDLSFLILNSAVLHNELLHFKYEYLGNQYYYGFKPGTNWINVYMQEEGTFRRFGYNPIEGRWSYKSEPKNGTYAILMMENITQYQLPFTHNWVINKSIER